VANFGLVRAAINHPVKVVKVLLECWHIAKPNTKNEGLSNAENIDDSKNLIILIPWIHFSLTSNFSGISSLSHFWGLCLAYALCLRLWGTGLK
jgi:hypothetical protein